MTAQDEQLLAPWDEANQELLSHVKPPDWRNPEPSGIYNLVVVGAGTAGLVSAAAGAMLGAKVALVEKYLLGGDCLNFGCVPSKGIIRAARALHDVRRAEEFGIRTGEVTADFGLAMERMRRLRAEIAHHDSAKRFSKLGIDVYLGEGRFVGRDKLVVGGKELRFRRAILATGARAAEIPIPGLADVSYLTNETVFSLTEVPKRLLVVGAGPIGCELSQTFARFGSQVTVVSLGRPLPREDEEAAAIVAHRLEADGVKFLIGGKLKAIKEDDRGKVVVFDRGRGDEEVAGDALLIAIGRAPNVEGLDLDKAGVHCDRRGVEVDDYLRTQNRRIYAAGDICTPYKFTHSADAMARIAVQNALFFGCKRVSSLVIPWCTFTDPEVAHVGFYESEAKEQGYDVETYRLDLAELDRAILEGETEGFAKIHVAPSGTILGATIVAAHAGEMIGEFALAVTRKMRLSDLGETILPYPTQAEIIKKVCELKARTRLTERVKTWFGRYHRLRARLPL